MPTPRTITEIEADREANLRAERHADPANMTRAERDSEAIELLERMAELETDAGSRGYTLGQRDNIRAGRHCEPAYLEQLRTAAAGQEADADIDASRNTLERESGGTAGTL